MESDKTICPAGICDAQTFMQSFSIHSIKDKSKSAAHVSLRQRRSAGQTIIGHSCPMNESWPKGTIKKYVQEQSTITMLTHFSRELSQRHNKKYVQEPSTITRFKNVPVRLSRFKSEYDYNVQEPAVAKGNLGSATEVCGDRVTRPNPQHKRFSVPQHQGRI